MATDSCLITQMWRHAPWWRGVCVTQLGADQQRGTGPARGGDGKFDAARRDLEPERGIAAGERWESALNEARGGTRPCFSEAGPTLGLGVGTVHLMELLEDASLVLFGNAWSRIGHADVEVAVDRLGGHAHLAGVRELDGVAHEVEQHLGEALLIAQADRKGLGHLSL